jgi:hypothetical protein
MAPVTDAGSMTEAPPDAAGFNFAGSLVVAVIVGAGLAVAARSGALQLLVAVAVVQGLLALSWTFALSVPGRIGALVIAALASAGADVAVSVWPHSRLGPVLAVFGLAVPVMFVHQLARGTGRDRLLESIGSIALLVLGEVALPALLQLRHEFHGAPVAAAATSGVVVAAAGALVVGYLVDLIYAAPRFDSDVPRGLLAVLASAGLGGSLGYLMLRSSAEFVGGRGAFAGAALGALVALFAVATAFFEFELPAAAGGLARRLRPVLDAVLPLSVLAPAAYVLCLAIRV